MCIIFTTPNSFLYYPRSDSSSGISCPLHLCTDLTMHNLVIQHVGKLQNFQLIQLLNMWISSCHVTGWQTKFLRKTLPNLGVKINEISLNPQVNHQFLYESCYSEGILHFQTHPKLILFHSIFIVVCSTPIYSWFNLHFQCLNKHS